ECEYCDVKTAVSRLACSVPSAVMCVGPTAVVLCFFFYCSGDHRDLHSFPTRRSSDLPVLAEPQPAVERIHPVEASCKLAVGHERSEEHTSELQSRSDLVCRLLLEKKKHTTSIPSTPTCHGTNTRTQDTCATRPPDRSP